MFTQEFITGERMKIATKIQTCRVTLFCFKSTLCDWCVVQYNWCMYNKMLNWFIAYTV